jgi:N-acetylneuraminic acid mutarotase
MFLRLSGISLGRTFVTAGLLTLCAVPCIAQTGGAWKRFADIPLPVYGPTTVLLDNKIHVLGGSELDAHQVFDPKTNTWEQKAPLPHREGIGWGMSAPLRGKIYFFGGGYGKEWRGDDRAYVYSPESDRWSAIASLPARRMQGIAVATQEAIYILGGHGGSHKKSREEETKIALKYDPAANTYARVADMPESGIFIVGAYYKGDICLIAGVERTVKNPTDAGEGYVWADGVLKYNPGRDAWTKVSIARPIKNTWSVTQQSSHAAFGPKLFVGGGGTPPDRRRTNRMFYYDMDQNKFVEIDPMPKVRCCAGGTVIDGQLYITAGFYNATGDRCPETWGCPLRSRGAEAAR